MMRKKAVLILTYGPFYQKLTKFYDHCAHGKKCVLVTRTLNIRENYQLIQTIIYVRRCIRNKLT